MADLTPDRLQELRRIAEAATPGQWSMHSEPEFSGPWSVGADNLPDSTVATAWAIEWSAEAAQANARHIAAFNPATALALLDRIEALEQERDAARAEAERWRDENEMLYRRIERLEAKVARQRVMLTRLQTAIERRATGDWVEATRRAMADEVVERYVREADVALDEAERWRQQYEALRAKVESVAQELRKRAYSCAKDWLETGHHYHDGASDAYYMAEEMVWRLLSEAGGGDT